MAEDYPGNNSSTKPEQIEPEFVQQNDGVYPGMTSETKPTDLAENISLIETLDYPGNTSKSNPFVLNREPDPALRKSASEKQYVRSQYHSSLAQLLLGVTLLLIYNLVFLANRILPAFVSLNQARYVNAALSVLWSIPLITAINMMLQSIWYENIMFTIASSKLETRKIYELSSMVFGEALAPFFKTKGLAPAASIVLVSFILEFAISQAGIINPISSVPSPVDSPSTISINRPGNILDFQNRFNGTNAAAIQAQWMAANIPGNITRFAVKANETESNTGVRDRQWIIYVPEGNYENVYRIDLETMAYSIHCGPLDDFAADIVRSDSSVLWTPKSTDTERWSQATASVSWNSNRADFSFPLSQNASGLPRILIGALTGNAGNSTPYGLLVFGSWISNSPEFRPIVAQSFNGAACKWKLSQAEVSVVAQSNLASAGNSFRWVKRLPFVSAAVGVDPTLLLVNARQRFIDAFPDIASTFDFTLYGGKATDLPTFKPTYDLLETITARILLSIPLFQAEEKREVNVYQIVTMYRIDSLEYWQLATIIGIALLFYIPLVVAYLQSDKYWWSTSGRISALHWKHFLSGPEWQYCENFGYISTMERSQDTFVLQQCDLGKIRMVQVESTEESSK